MLAALHICFVHFCQGSVIVQLKPYWHTEIVTALCDHLAFQPGLCILRFVRSYTSASCSSCALRRFANTAKAAFKLDLWLYRQQKLQTYSSCQSGQNPFDLPNRRRLGRKAQHLAPHLVQKLGPASFGFLRRTLVLRVNSIRECTLRKGSLTRLLSACQLFAPSARMVQGLAACFRNRVCCTSAKDSGAGSPRGSSTNFSLFKISLPTASESGSKSAEIASCVLSQSTSS